MCLFLLSLAFQIQACSSAKVGMETAQERRNGAAIPTLQELVAKIAKLSRKEQAILEAIKKVPDSIDFYGTDLAGRTILHRAVACKGKAAFWALFNKARLKREVGIRTLLLKKLYGRDSAPPYSILTAAVMTRPRWFRLQDDAFEKFEFVLRLTQPYLELQDFQRIKRELYLIKEHGKINPKEHKCLIQIVDTVCETSKASLQARTIQQAS